LYLAVLIDLYSRRLAGWAMSERIGHGAGDVGAQHGARAAQTGARPDSSHRSRQQYASHEYRRRCAISALSAA